MEGSDLDWLDTIRRRFDFNTWPKRSRLGWALFVSNLALRGDEIPGMTPVRSRRIVPSSLLGVPEASGISAQRLQASSLQHLPRVHLESVWRDLARPVVVMRVDIFECASEFDAHDKAVWMLGEFESPMIEQSQGVGDVVASTRSDSVV